MASENIDAILRIAGVCTAFLILALGYARQKYLEHKLTKKVEEWLRKEHGDKLQADLDRLAFRAELQDVWERARR